MTPILCPKCSRQIPDDARLCCYCGRVFVQRRAARSKRGNGQGCVWRRGDRWEARITLGWVERPGKRPKQLCTTKGGFRTKAEAVAYLPTLRALTEKPKKAPFLEHYWDLYANGELEKLSESKSVAYHIAWKKLSALHHRPVDAISVQELRDAVNGSCSTYYPARDCKQLLKNLYKLAGADGWVQKDLPDYILLPDRDEKRREPFSVQEQRTLWKAYESGVQDAALPLIMIYTGMMPGELQQLRPEMIDWDAHQITGVGMKTKVRRESPIWFPDALVPVLQDLIAASTSDSGYVLPRNETAFYARYYAALEAAGVRRLEPYSCRHTTATALAIDQGIAPQTIQRIMRWSSTRMLDRYAHPDDAAAAAGIASILPDASQ